jgi:hypothetical protein
LKTFEEKTAAAIRSLTITCIVLGIALLIAIGVAAWGLGDASTATTRADVLTSQLKANVQSQVENRTANVATWCGAINGDRTYNRVFVAHVTRGHIVYTLADLDCKALEAKTLASTKPH